jgi:hypothetical protein
MNTDTLFGGRKIEVYFEPLPEGSTPPAQTMTVRQIPVRDYDVGLKYFTDEIALVAFLVGRPREFAFTLSPQSYEEILSVGKEVNARGFFAFCQRRIEAKEQMDAAALVTIAQLPDEARKLVLSQGAKMTSLNSSDSSSIPQPRRV